MPWTVSDVESKKKGLTDEQKKAWVRRANSIYKKCIAGGDNEDKCAQKAIRLANSMTSIDPKREV